MEPEHYDALRRGAGVLRRTTRGLIAVEGADGADFLQGLLTNDIAALEAGAGCYAAYLTPQGRMLADMDVFHVAQGERILLDVDRAAAAELAARLESLIFSEEAAAHDWSTTHAACGVHGPAARDVAAAALERLGAGDEAAAGVRGLAPHGCLTASAGDLEIVAARNDELGVPGLALIVARNGAEAVQAALLAAGGVEVETPAAETVRVESGRPAFPIDMDTETIPLEAGIEDRAISLTKGCYVGQEVIIRVLHRGGGRVARKLVGLTLAADGNPAGGDGGMPARGATVNHDGQSVGKVTSAVFSPALGRIVALAWVPRALAEAGTRVVVEQDGGVAAAVVTRLPFVDPESGRAAEN